MGSRKDANEPEGADTLMRLAGYAPRTLQRVVSRARVEPADVRPRGLEHPRPARAALDARLRLEEAYPIVPFADSHSLSVGLTTVCDEAFLGLYVDRRALPGADRLAELVNAEFDELARRGRAPFPLAS